MVYVCVPWNTITSLIYMYSPLLYSQRYITGFQHAYIHASDLNSPDLACLSSSKAVVAALLICSFNYPIQSKLGILHRGRQLLFYTQGKGIVLFLELVDLWRKPKLALISHSWAYVMHVSLQTGCGNDFCSIDFIIFRRWRNGEQDEMGDILPMQSWQSLWPHVMS